MDKIYYQPNYLWKGQKIIKKLRELSKEKLKAIKQWLSKQVHLPPPKHVDRPHYEVTIPNEMHQFDLFSLLKTIEFFLRSFKRSSQNR